MPTFKHPCPRCGKWIERDVRACPFCGAVDPFVAGRCPECRAPVEAGWVACAKCGASLTQAAATDPPGPATAPTASSSTAGAAPAQATCAGCGAPLAAGARFCTVCGTLVASD